MSLWALHLGWQGLGVAGCVGLLGFIVSGAGVSIRDVIVFFELVLEIRRVGSFGSQTWSKRTPEPKKELCLGLRFIGFRLNRV